MNAQIHDILNLVTTVIGCVCVLGAIAAVNFSLSRDQVVSRNMRHHS